ncbi:MAG: response regulator [Gammaproteobacteria bacterium]|nr:response regulator [Gammaproteobacteria bacterium]MCH9744146.1 response regulator [Gammaproteobacteria bacterium]
MRRGLKSKLMLSHGLIALCGTLLLVICLIAILRLQRHTEKLVHQAVPTVYIAGNLQTNLQASLAALRGWMNVRDSRFIKERNDAWRNGIDVNLNKLTALVNNSDDIKTKKEILQLRNQLEDLKMWQWRIEDVAQAPGNNPAAAFMKEQVNPSAEHIISYVASLISQEQQSRPEAPASYIYLLAGFKSYFVKSLSSLAQYVLTGNKASLDESQKALSLAESQINSLEKKSAALTRNQRPVWKNLTTSFHYYNQLVKQLISLRLRDGQSIASMLLVQKAVPLARSSNTLLSGIINTEKHLQVAASYNTERLTQLIIYGIIAFIIIMILLSLWLANSNANRFLSPISLLLDATKKISKGKLSHNIEVLSDDEIGQLTDSFNTMLHLRQVAEQKTRQVVETAVDPILTIDAKGVVQSMNSATTELLGYTEEDLLGSNISIIMPEPYGSQHDQYLKNYLKTKSKKVIGKTRELKAQTKKGEIIPIVLSVSEIIVEGEYLFTGFIRDVRVENKLVAEANKLNESLANENHERSISAKLENTLRGADDITQFANDTLQFFAENFDVSLAMLYVVDALEKTISLVGGYGYKERRNRATVFQWGEGLLGECVETQKIITITEPPKDYFKIASGIGEALPKLILLVPLMVEDGVIGVIELCTLHDVVGDEQTFVDALCQNVAIYLQMLLAKKKLQQLYDETQLQKQNLQQQEEELRASNEELESQADTLKQSEEELRSTNEELSIQVKLIEKQKKELKNRTDEVSKSSQYKSEFLANMSHELRTPLNSLLILAQGFMNNRAGNLTVEQLEEAKIIYEAGTDLLTLINDILDISKVEAGKLTIEIITVQLQDIIGALKKQFEPMAQEKKIEFRIECDKTTPEEIQTDQVRLLQILKNLISNAIKFTHEGSVSVKIAVQGDSVGFKVIDTGIGIPKDKQKLIFSEFQQADGSTSRKYGGTGLGLSISRKLVDLMQGKLALESTEGKGSIFSLLMPLNPEVEQKTKVNTKPKLSEQLIKLPEDIHKIPREMPDDREHLKSDVPTLLVVDDDKNFAGSLAKLIHENKFQVLLALTGTTGLQLAAAYQPSGIILDLGLPDISGESVLLALKGDSRTHDTPVHVVSASDRSHEVIDKGAFSFLQKPVKQGDIEALISQMSDINLSKILIVEDDQVAQKGLKEIFTTLQDSVEVDFSETAADAKIKLKDTLYTCVIVDLGLPDASGIELIQSLVDEMNVLVPIIVYTARELTPGEFKAVKKYTNKVVIKGAEAMERLVDEVQLFVHHVEEKTGYDSKLIRKEPMSGDKFNSQHVLLVDDDLRNTFALSRALEAENLNVTIADNGELALEKLEGEETFDIILMDMMMPVMDGYEAIKKIKADQKHQNIPIIALTAKATQQDREQCIEAGANDYMSKPIVVENLLELMSVWISDSGESS